MANLLSPLWADKCEDCKTRYSPAPVAARVARGLAVSDSAIQAVRTTQRDEPWLVDEAAPVDGAIAHRQREDVDQGMWEAEQTVRSGRAAFLLDSVYVGVDSEVNMPTAVSFDLGAARQHTHVGWDVVAVVPRTVGVGLTNLSLGGTAGQTWGAGLGGNLAGVYFVLRYVVTAETWEASRPTLTQYFQRHAPRASCGLGRSLSG